MREATPEEARDNKRIRHLSLLTQARDILLSAATELEDDLRQTFWQILDHWHGNFPNRPAPTTQATLPGIAPASDRPTPTIPGDPGPDDDEKEHA